MEHFFKFWFHLWVLVFAVTTTNQAIKALKMLRENRNKFDLVISDVNMPDMDGFKLLELVGLEMDLPVISKNNPFFPISALLYFEKFFESLMHTLIQITSQFLF